MKLEIVPIETADILSFSELGAIEEMHDRLIAGLVLKMDGILITKDEVIRASKKIKVLW